MGMKKYTKSHEWVEIAGDIATVGITEHAQKLLGDVVYVDLPETGKKVEKGEILCTIDSVKAASDVYAPLSGVVQEVNGELDATPETVNQDAEGAGWIVRIQVSEEISLEGFLDKEAYLKQAEEEE
ncbi:MAG TPA: glycine cleavage system protein GcvH [Thermotogota bacterium]|nr:glycine cleavage system protein GcvH [Thermotogota bacterium]HRW91728.1 glycine cleavage system protein GcvH [Thermotogota bacterium]